MPLSEPFCFLKPLLMEFAENPGFGNMATPIRYAFSSICSCKSLTRCKQANPLSCAASVAVQEIIVEENLLENCRTQGAYLCKHRSAYVHFTIAHKIDLAQLLHQRLRGPNSLSRPYVYDIRGGGLFWGIEFDFEVPDAAKVDLKGQKFAIVAQARMLQNGLIIMGFVGGANIEGTKGNHLMLSPAYNVTKDEIEKIVDVFVNSVEQVLRESFV